jgi:hypothetical protein
VGDLFRVLNMMQNNADSKRQTSIHTWLDINNSLDDGTTIDYSTFDKLYNANPKLKNIVQRYDGNGVVLKTKVKPEDQVTVNKKPGNLDRMAKRAAAKEIKT